MSDIGLDMGMCVGVLGRQGTYTIVQVTPKLARACMQKPLFDGVAYEQPLVMYHGRPGLGFLGSLMSGVDWLRRETAKRASMRPWTKTLSIGRKRCMTNTTTFTSRMNIPRTEATTLKVVVL
jgi:hypothetical protein